MSGTPLRSRSPVSSEAQVQGDTTNRFSSPDITSGISARAGYPTRAPVQSSGTAEPPVTGPAVRISVAGRSLGPGGIVPLAVGIPALIAAATAAQHARRRRRA